MNFRLLPLKWPQPFSPGIACALGAAFLFGASTPLKKWMLMDIGVWWMSSLLGIGGGLVTALLFWQQEGKWSLIPPLTWRQGVNLSFCILTGAFLAPGLLAWGLTYSSAAAVSLLLNLEGILTVVLAWAVFREPLSRPLLAGTLLIVCGGLVLSWNSGDLPPHWLWGSLLVAVACLAWAVDNNLSRRISGLNAIQIASLRGFMSGLFCGVVAIVIREPLPSGSGLVAALGLGSLMQGVGLILFLLALRYLGAARFSAYFSTAPFTGTLIAVIGLGESFTPQLAIAGALMVIGVAFCVAEHIQSPPHNP